jgi:hypothetical protein
MLVDTDVLLDKLQSDPAWADPLNEQPPDFALDKSRELVAIPPHITCA